MIDRKGQQLSCKSTDRRFESLYVHVATGFGEIQYTRYPGYFETAGILSLYPNNKMSNTTNISTAGNATPYLTFRVMQTEKERVRTYHNRIGGESVLSDYFGLNFGISENQYQFPRRDPSRNLAVGFFQYAIAGEIYKQQVNNAFPPLISYAVFYANLAPQIDLSRDIIQTPTLDLGFTYHPLKRNFFDPFLGIGTDTCAILLCKSVKGFIKAGAQFNFENYFFFVQLERQQIHTRSYRRPVLTNDMIFFGGGIIWDPK